MLYEVITEASSILTEGSVTVSGSVEHKAQRSADFTTVVYDNPEKTHHEVFQIKPAQRLEFYYELALIIILIPAVMFIGIIIWLKKKPKFREEKSSPV